MEAIMEAFIKVSAVFAAGVLLSIPGLIFYGIQYKRHKEEWDADE